MRVIALLLALPLLAGCAAGDWDYLTSFGTSERAEAAPAPKPETVARTTPAPAQPAPNAFCLAVARQDATGNGFDTATQAKVAQRSYLQCVGIFGNAPE
jgi:hypothetical protein